MTFKEFVAQVKLEDSVMEVFPDTVDFRAVMQVCELSYDAGSKYGDRELAPELSEWLINESAKLLAEAKAKA